MEHSNIMEERKTMEKLKKGNKPTKVTSDQPCRPNILRQNPQPVTRPNFLQHNSQASSRHFYLGRPRPPCHPAVMSLQSVGHLLPGSCYVPIPGRHLSFNHPLGSTCQNVRYRQSGKKCEKHMGTNNVPNSTSSVENGGQSYTGPYQTTVNSFPKLAVMYQRPPTEMSGTQTTIGSKIVLTNMTPTTPTTNTNPIVTHKSTTIVDHPLVTSTAFPNLLYSIPPVFSSTDDKENLTSNLAMRGSEQISTVGSSSGAKQSPQNSILSESGNKPTFKAKVSLDGAQSPLKSTNAPTVGQLNTDDNVPTSSSSSKQGKSKVTTQTTNVPTGVASSLHQDSKSKDSLGMSRAEKGHLTSELQSLKTSRLQPTVLRRKGKSEMFEVHKGLNIEAVAQRLKTSDSQGEDDKYQFCQKVTVEALPINLSSAYVTDSTTSSSVSVEPLKGLIVVSPVIQPESVSSENIDGSINQSNTTAKSDTEENLICDLAAKRNEAEQKSTESMSRSVQELQDTVQSIEDNNCNQEKEALSSPAEFSTETQVNPEKIMKNSKSKLKTTRKVPQDKNVKTELRNKILNKVETVLQSNQEDENEASNKTNQVEEKEKQTSNPKRPLVGSVSITSSPMYPKRKRRVAAVGAAASSAYYKQWMGNTPSPKSSNTSSPISSGRRKPSTRCTHCSMKFMKYSNLCEHKKSVHGIKKQRPKPYKCYECKKCFESRLALTDHENTHLGLRPYSCEYCGQCFAAHTNFSNHRWKHLRNDDEDVVFHKRKRSGTTNKRLAPSELLPAKGRVLPIINDKGEKLGNETIGWKKAKQGYIRHFKRAKKRSSGLANISRKRNRVTLESNKTADESPLKRLEAKNFQLEIADIRSLSTGSPVTIKQEPLFTDFYPEDEGSSPLSYSNGRQPTVGNEGVYMDIDVVDPLVKSAPDSPSQSAAVPDLPPLPHVLDCYVADSQLFRCSFCDVYYMERQHYLLHAALHSASNPWKCSVCNITFDGKDEFALHFITHKHCDNV